MWSKANKNEVIIIDLVSKRYGICPYYYITHPIALEYAAEVAGIGSEHEAEQMKKNMKKGNK